MNVVCCSCDWGFKGEETHVVRKFTISLSNDIASIDQLHFCNVYLNILYFSDESTRIALQPIRGVDGSDYINASFINVSTTSSSIDQFDITNIFSCFWNGSALFGDYWNLYLE